MKLLNFVVFVVSVVVVVVVVNVGVDAKCNNVTMGREPAYKILVPSENHFVENLIVNNI